ncbi:MAG: glycosyltransferase family 2 protein [Bacteroidota bacterium]
MPFLDEPSVAIILVNWNGMEDTKRCLRSLDAVSYPRKEVLVVDNGSNPHEVAELEAIDGIHKIFNSENLGFTGGNNVGIRWALEQAMDLILLLNNDTEVERNFLEPLLKVITDPDVGAVQPKIRYLERRDTIWNAGGRFSDFTGQTSVMYKDVIDTNLPQEPYEVHWITGCALMFEASLAQEVGVLDDSFFAYFEDVDYSLRLRKKARLICVPESVVYHAVSSASKTKTKGSEGYVSASVHYLNVRNHLYLVRKHMRSIGLGVSVTFQTLRFCLMVVYFLLRRRFKKLSAAARGYRDGWQLSVRQ